MSLRINRAAAAAAAEAGAQVAAGAAGDVESGAGAEAEAAGAGAEDPTARALALGAPADATAAAEGGDEDEFEGEEGNEATSLVPARQTEPSPQERARQLPTVHMNPSLTHSPPAVHSCSDPLQLTFVISGFRLHASSGRCWDVRR